jgi:transposase
LAVQRVQDGYSVAEVARFLGVAERSIYRWLARVRDHGERVGLKPKPHFGPKPRLNIEQDIDILTYLETRPTCHGFATDVWTAPRVAEIIERRFGIKYHPRYVNQWLRERGVTPQRPTRKAREQDPQVVDRWLSQDWPSLLALAKHENGWLVFIDEAGLLLEPLYKRSQAPRGQPLELRPPGVTRRKVSLLAALAWKPATGEMQLLSWYINEGNFNSAAVAGVLTELLQTLKGRVDVVWDRGQMHKGEAIKEVREGSGGRLGLHFQPAYTPHVQPVEQLWSLLKYGRLGNFVPRGILHLSIRANEELVKIAEDSSLLRGCFHGTILPLPDNMTLAA